MLITRAVLFTVASSLEAILVGVMTLRKQYREFGFFYGYVGFETIRDVAAYWVWYLIVIHQVSYAVYFYTYWITDLIATGICFVLVYQIFNLVFSGHPVIRRVGKGILLWAAAASLIAAILVALFSRGSEVYRLSTAVLLLGRTISLMRCGLLLALFLTSTYLALCWQSRVLGIALGLGVWSAIDLAAIGLRLSLGPKSQGPLDWVVLIGYTFPVLIWSAYFLPKRSEPAAVAVRPQLRVAEWNEALAELLHQ